MREVLQGLDTADHRDREVIRMPNEHIPYAKRKAWERTEEARNKKAKSEKTFTKTDIYEVANKLVETLMGYRHILFKTYVEAHIRKSIYGVLENIYEQGKKDMEHLICPHFDPICDCSFINEKRDVKEEILKQKLATLEEVLREINNEKMNYYLSDAYIKYIEQQIAETKKELGGKK